MKCQRCQQSDAEATPQATSSSPPGPSGAGSANPANEHSLAVIDWAGNVLRHIDTSTNNTQPKENQMIESTDEELAEAIDEAHRELDALRPGNYQPNSLNTGDQGRVLPTAARNVNGQRRADYGPALESFQRIADIANAGLGHKLAEDLTPEDICWLLLYALKGSRAAQGLRTGTFHHDTYADTAGYAAVAEIIHLQREGENA